MSFADSLHDLLERDDCNIEAVRCFLERDSSSINARNSVGCTPLQKVLRSKNCSVDIVKLLLQYGADVNCNYGTCSPLMTAIRSSGDEAVIQVLLEKGADVNQGDPLSFDETPLLMLLKNVNCSTDLVKLLLHYGADVKCKDKYGYSPLVTALQNSRDEAVIKLLLENGASVNTLTNFKRSPLCIAFAYTSSDIVKLLLDSGCLPKACNYHFSALHCATNYARAGLREDILERIIQNPTDVNTVDSNGQSILCFALRNGAVARDIELLLNKGASLNACTKHSSPLICATGGSNRTPLKASVIKLLSNIRFDVGFHGLKVLQNALKYCNYEPEAIQLLFELPGMDTHINDETLLHHAVYNPNCKVDILKLLAKDKQQLEKVNQYDETPLHCAVRECEPIIVDFLLEKGSSVNAVNRFKETPLALAVKSARGCRIIKSLFVAGAQFSEAKSSKECALLEVAFRQYQPHTVQHQACLKIFVKYFFLQFHQSDMQDFMDSSRLEFYSSERNHDYSECKAYANECWSELQKMKSMQIGSDCTLHDFISCQCLPEMNSASSNQGVKYYDLNQILRCLTENAFAVYFDIICSDVERSAIEAELQKRVVYTNTICPISQTTKKVCLNNEIVYKIAGLLAHEDAMRWLLAYNGNHVKSGLASEGNIPVASTSAS